MSLRSVARCALALPSLIALAQPHHINLLASQGQSRILSEPERRGAEVISFPLPLPLLRIEHIDALLAKNTNCTGFSRLGREGVFGSIGSWTERFPEPWTS